MENNKINRVIKAKENKPKKQKITVASIVANYIKFCTKERIKKTIIYFACGVGLFLILLTTYVNIIKANNLAITQFSIKANIIEKLKLNSIIILSSLVPYLYVPVVSFFVLVFAEIGSVSSLIATYGYKLGLLKGVIPFILSTLSYAMITTHSMYLFQIYKIKLKLNNMSVMNFTIFRIKAFESFKKFDKAKALQKKYDEKKANLENKKEKINYINVLITYVVASLIQIIAVLIYKLVI